MRPHLALVFILLSQFAYSAEKESAELLLLDAQSSYTAGNTTKAIIQISRARDSIGPSTLPSVAGSIYRLSGSLDIARHRYNTSLQYMKSARELAAANIERAQIDNDIGNILALTGKPSAALVHYNDAIGSAGDTGDRVFKAQIYINRARSHIALNRTENAVGDLTNALKLSSQLDERRISADINYRIAEVGLGSASNSAGLDKVVYEALDEGLSASRLTGDERLESKAIGLTGLLYVKHNRFDEALTLFRDALSIAEASKDSELAYRWLSQIALAHKALGSNDEAIKSGRNAVAMLRNLQSADRYSADNLQLSLARDVVPFLEGHADVLLKEAANTATPSDKTQLLVEARDVVERASITNLQNLLGDECVLEAEKLNRSADSVDEHSAVIYPVIFDDRLEIIVSGKGYIEQFTVNVRETALILKIRALHNNLRSPTSKLYKAHSRALYRWLVEPMRALLKEKSVDNLVFVPNGPLGLVPPAALFDGEHYLIEDFAVTMTPGLTVTHTGNLSNNPHIVAAGLSNGAEGFEALPGVKEELDYLERIFSDTQRLEDEEFSTQGLEKVISKRAPEVIHFASHGKVGKSAEESFILTKDGRLSINEIDGLVNAGRDINSPVKLLTLSACETAVGDDDAALGLGGLAVKSGSESVLASLWLISDEASSDLMNAFYTEIRRGLPRSKALQKAQITMLAKDEYPHPFFWGSFVLIGNWL